MTRLGNFIFCLAIDTKQKVMKVGRGGVQTVRRSALVLTSVSLVVKFVAGYSPITPGHRATTLPTLLHWPPRGVGDSNFPRSLGGVERHLAGISATLTQDSNPGGWRGKWIVSKRR